MQGDLGLPFMSAFGVRSPGHEGAGVVVKVGANVKTFKLGDRAGIKPMMDTCGSCALCWDDKETYFKGAILTGLQTAGKANSKIIFNGLNCGLLYQVLTSNTWYHQHDMHHQFQMGSLMKLLAQLCVVQALCTDL